LLTSNANPETSIEKEVGLGNNHGLATAAPVGRWSFIAVVSFLSGVASGEAKAAGLEVVDKLASNLALKTMTAVLQVLVGSTSRVQLRY
jgi:hypothetical protein